MNSIEKLFNASLLGKTREQVMAEYLYENREILKRVVDSEKKDKGFTLRSDILEIKDNKAKSLRMSEKISNELDKFCEKTERKKVEILNMAVLEFLEKYGDVE